jgi:hypothetical protein
MIPANSKRSMLIFNMFTFTDLLIFGIGSALSMILVLIVPLSSASLTMLALAPGLISGFLVIPIANYHNVLYLLTQIYDFYTSRQKYVWKGWCFLNGEEKK